MNKALLYIIGLLIISSASAQQLSLTDFYFVNAYNLNPAAAGEKGTNLFLQNRQQWKDIPGAPETTALTFDTKINGRNVGVGVNLSIDADNVYRKTMLGASYSYSISFGEKHYLSMGLSLNVINTRVAYDQIESADWSDPLLFASSKSVSNISGDAGLNYRFNNLHIGLAGYQLPGTRMLFQSNGNVRQVSYQLVQHFWGVINYEFHLLNNKLSISPEIQARTTIGLPLQLDAGLNFEVLSVAQARLAYRHNSSVYLALAFDIYDNLSIGCAYDYSVGAIADFSGSTYELIIGYKIIRNQNEESNSAENRKFDKSMKRNMQEQSEQLDKLEYENKSMKDEIDNNKEQITILKEEIEQLKKRAELSDEDMKLLNDIKKNHEFVDTDYNSQDRSNDANNNSDSIHQNPTLNNNFNKTDNSNSQDSRNNRNDNEISAINSKQEVTEDISGQYCVIVGAYRDINYAKQGQKILQREINLETTLIREETGNFYFICSNFFDSKQEVQAEKERLHLLNIEDYIVGKPWTYVKFTKNN
ncbi:MAG: PorP/SprF family type IX secretion system membrane protein [Bacteroidales bacterium]|nr:PorP/SprF family type IX secretion system membrane protein [Bacteroidales bacterium]